MNEKSLWRVTGFDNTKLWVRASSAMSAAEKAERVENERRREIWSKEGADEDGLDDFLFATRSVDFIEDAIQVID